MASPKNIVERLFLKELELVPLKPVISRNPYGILHFKWVAPCAEIGGLWASVKPLEITLSCKITHIHFSRDFIDAREQLTSMQLKRRIVHDSIREVIGFLRGDIAATISYDDKGQEHGSGWCKTKQLADSLEYSKKVFGPGMTQKAWTWFGQVQ